MVSAYITKKEKLLKTKNILKKKMRAILTIAILKCSQNSSE